jgi:hypothetical protein
VHPRNLKCSLQEKAAKWHENREIDGLTTNGVLVMHPRGSFCGGGAKCGLWREVSVGGGVYSIRGPRSAQRKGEVVSVNTVLEKCEHSPVFLKTYSDNFSQRTPRPLMWSFPFWFSDWNVLLISHFSHQFWISLPNYPHSVFFFSVLVTSIQGHLFFSSLPWSLMMTPGFAPT